MHNQRPERMKNQSALNLWIKCFCERKGSFGLDNKNYPFQRVATTVSITVSPSFIFHIQKCTFLQQHRDLLRFILFDKCKYYNDMSGLEQCKYPSSGTRGCKWHSAFNTGWERCFITSAPIYWNLSSNVNVRFCIISTNAPFRIIFQIRWICFPDKRYMFYKFHFTFGLAATPFSDSSDWLDQQSNKKNIKSKISYHS